MGAASNEGAVPKAAADQPPAGLNGDTPAPKLAVWIPKSPASPAAPAAPSPVAPAAPAGMEDNVVALEVAKRLTENKEKKIGWSEVSKLRAEFDLSEQVELGMKVLHPAKLWQLLRSQPDPRSKLSTAADKEQTAKMMISEQDPEVAQLVEQLGIQ